MATKPVPGQNPYDTSWWEVTINDDGSTKLTLNSVGLPTVAVNVNGQNVSNLATPLLSTDAVTKAYADALSTGLNVKFPVVAATTANITLSATQTVDGVALNVSDRVLVKNQTTGADNGIYVVASGAWTRASDADTSGEVTSGMYVLVVGGTAQAGEGWVLTTANPITLGTTTLTFAQFSSPSTGINPSIVTTKGDLIVATASNAVARQAVGTNTQILTADNAQATGVKWAAPAVVALDAAGAPTDIITLNATTSAHGLLPKLPGGTTSFLRGDGTFVTPPGTGSVTQVTSAGGTVTVTNPTGPIVNVEAPASASRDAWSTTMSANATAGATSINVVDALPLFKMIGGIANLHTYIVIDAWTVNAEFFLCGVDATGKTLGFAGGIAKNHSAGATVLLVEDFDLHVNWFGVNTWSGANPTTNSTQLNALFSQLHNNTNNPVGLGVRVFGTLEGINTAAPVVVQSSGVSEIIGLNLNAQSDFGVNTAILDKSAATCALTRCNVSSIVGVPGFSTFVSGGSVTWVNMDGFRINSRSVVTGCGASGVNRGFYLGFFDHAVLRDCGAQNCFYGYYFQGSTNAGDAAFTGCGGSQCYRSIWGWGNGSAQPEGSTFANCSWVLSPFIWFFEGASIMLDVTLSDCNLEFYGNSFCYIANGGGSGGTFNRIKVLGTEPDFGAAPGGGWNDSNYPGPGAFIYNNSGGRMFVGDIQGQTSGNGTVFGFGAGADIEFTVAGSSFNTSKGAPTAIVAGGTGGTTYPSVRLDTGQSRGYGVIATSGTVNAGDLLEWSGASSQMQQSQTPHRKHSGVALRAASSSNAMVLVEGIVTVNCGTNTVAAGQPVVADFSQPGCVKQVGAGSGATYISTVLADGAVGFWPLSETAFASAAVDLAGNQNGVYTNTAGLVYGPSHPSIAGSNGLTAPLFISSSSGYVAVADSSAQHVGDTFTVEAWLKIASVAADQTLFSSASANSIYFVTGTSGGSTKIVGRQTTTGAVVSSSSSLFGVDSTFHHCVWTKSGATSHIYVDGIDVTAAGTNATMATSSGYGIGDYAPATNNFINGHLAMVSLYPTALTKLQVQTHYVLGASIPGRTVGSAVTASSSSQVQVELA